MIAVLPLFREVTLALGERLVKGEGWRPVEVTAGIKAGNGAYSKSEVSRDVFVKGQAVGILDFAGQAVSCCC